MDVKDVCLERMQGHEKIWLETTRKDEIISIFVSVLLTWASERRQGELVPLDFEI